MTTSTNAPPALEVMGDDSAIARATMRRVSLRLLPFILLLYILNYIDRTNVGIAALQMNRDLGFSAAAYSFGAGVFFVAYALFEVPSNLFLARVGARWWIARIMISWGLVAAAMMFIRTPTHFYAMRFLLGVTEAGFFPGIVFYISEWFPVSMRARASSRFMIAIPFANIIGGLLGGWLLALDGSFGLKGWQWLFLLEGIPSVVMGCVVFMVLTNKPADARWLSDEQRGWLMHRLERDDDSSRAPHGVPPLKSLLSGVLWLTALPLLLLNCAAYGYQFWGPTFIKETLGSANAQTGFVFAGIGVVTAISMLFVSASSDRMQERFKHTAACGLIVALGCVGAAIAPTPVLKVCSIALIPMGVNSFLSPYFCIPGIMFRGSALAVAIALVNSIGNLGGFLGPNVIGQLIRFTGGTTGAFYSLAFLALIGSGICLLLGRNKAFST